MSDYKKILELIEAYDTICIFRHVRPDGDAVGSQLGLKEWIKANYPQKKVYAIGKEVYEHYPFIDEVEDEVISNSLAIILDTSNRERIDDDRWTKATTSIKIDHHPGSEDYADFNFLKAEAAATCEYLTEILISFFNKSITKEAAKYLYAGLLTDTMRFSTATTNNSTMHVASVLASTGIPIYEIGDEVFKLNRHIYSFRTYLRSVAKYEEGLCYAIIDQENLKNFDISDSRARFQVSELGGVDEHKIWAIFTENSEGKYDGSLRSKKGYVVNEVASNFNGGGHENAAGCKDLSLADIETAIKQLHEVIDSKTND